MAREALGRGLRALLEGTDMVGDAELLHLPVSQVHPNPYQPRQHFDPERLQELAKDGRAKPSHLVALEETLQQHFGTRVAIRPGRKHSKIEITYTGEDELRRLLTVLQLQPETVAPDVSGQARRHDEK